MKTEPVWFETEKDKKRFDSLRKDIQTDVAVIGGGIVGVSSAFFLEKEGVNVVLLEKNHIGTGDSGYSSAFLTRTPDASASQIVKDFGQETLNDVFEATSTAQKKIFDIIKNNKINCDFKECNSYYLTYKKDKDFDKEWKYIQKADKNAELVSSNDKLGIKFSEAVMFKNEGKFDIREYLIELSKKLKNVFEETEVTSIEFGKEIKIKTNNATVTANKVLITTGNPNELTGLNLVEPILSYIISLEGKIPLSDDTFWDTFDPYYYYRKINDKLMIVGGCDSKEFDDKAYEKIKKFSSEKFGNLKIMNEWSGTQYKTKDNLPYVFKFKDNAFVATGFNGSGLVFGTFAATMMTDFCLNKKNKYERLFSLKRKS